MTNGWVDIKNTDMMLIMGGNPAENHPCGFKWAIEAKRNRNAKIIVVDPRFTRTAATADLFCQIRAGVRYCLPGRRDPLCDRKQPHRQRYLVNYTNAAFIVKDGFKLPRRTECSRALTRQRRLMISPPGITRRKGRERLPRAALPSCCQQR